MKAKDGGMQGQACAELGPGTEQSGDLRFSPSPFSAYSRLYDALQWHI